MVTFAVRRQGFIDVTPGGVSHRICGTDTPPGDVTEKHKQGCGGVLRQGAGEKEAKMKQERRVLESAGELGIVNTNY